MSVTIVIVRLLLFQEIRGERMSEASYRNQFEWRSSKIMKCSDCGFKTNDRGTMLFHLVIGHQKIEELLAPFVK